MKVEDLVPTAAINKDKFEKYRGMSGSPPPVEYITDTDGTNYIVDGNHRWFVALAKGLLIIPAIPFVAPAYIIYKLLQMYRGRK